MNSCHRCRATGLKWFCISTSRCSTWSTACFAACFRRALTRRIADGRATNMWCNCEIVSGPSIRCKRTSPVGTRCTTLPRRAAPNRLPASLPPGSTGFVWSFSKRAVSEIKQTIGLYRGLLDGTVIGRRGLEDTQRHQPRRRYSRHDGVQTQSAGRSVNAEDFSRGVGPKASNSNERIPCVATAETLDRREAVGRPYKMPWARYNLVDGCHATAPQNERSASRRIR